MSAPPKTPLPPPLLAILKAGLHGIQYAFKIRLPHALMMTFLFSPNLSLRSKIGRILKLVVGHAKNLGGFALLYIALLEGAKLLQPHDGSTRAGRPLKPIHSAIAGSIGGYFVWGHFEQVNYQVIQYLLPRLLISYSQILARKGVWPFKAFSFEDGGGSSSSDGAGGKWYKPGAYRILSMAVWAGVMYLYEHDSETMPGGLQASMDEIYGGGGVNFPFMKKKRAPVDPPLRIQ
jgi:peroxisomal membrane protein 4